MIIDIDVISVLLSMIAFMGLIGILMLGWYLAGHALNGIEASAAKITDRLKKARERRLSRKKKAEYDDYYAERLSENGGYIANEDPLMPFYIESQQESNK